MNSLNKAQLEWRDIPWYTWLYQISNLWEIRSLKNNHGLFREKILKPDIWKNWYVHYRLSKSWVSKKYLAHRLVMKVFKWGSYLDINHVNWIKTDNSIGNLEYCTKSENQKHAWDTWLMWQKAIEACKRNLKKAITNVPKDSIYLAIEKRKKPIRCFDIYGNALDFSSLNDAWRSLNILPSGICLALKSKIKSYKWFTWIYI